MSSHNSNEWQKAMNEEMHTLGENDTFDLITYLQIERRRGKMALYHQNGPKGETKYKARYLAKGYSQRY